jgi:xanthine dehydrogenase iron-sulfur cluster and FAD-binding subunit A
MAVMVSNILIHIACVYAGTKVTCKEGGCGACVVAITKQDLLTGKEKTIAVNSVSFKSRHLCGKNPPHSSYLSPGK